MTPEALGDVSQVHSDDPGIFDWTAALQLRFELDTHDRQACLLEQLHQLVGGNRVDEHWHAEPGVGPPGIISRLGTQQYSSTWSQQLSEAPEEGGIVVTKDVVDQVQGDDCIERSYGKVDVTSVTTDERGCGDVRPCASNLLLGDINPCDRVLQREFSGRWNAVPTTDVQNARALREVSREGAHTLQTRPGRLSRLQRFVLVSDFVVATGNDLRVGLGHHHSNVQIGASVRVDLASKGETHRGGERLGAPVFGNVPRATSGVTPAASWVLTRRP